MKDPAFLFYPADYLGGTMGMTFEEKGAYIELLMLQFNRGHMTSHMIGHTVGQIWESIKGKFVQDGNGLYYNERLELEQMKRRAYVDSRKKNVKGINQYSDMGGHMTDHMVNVNNTVVKEEVKEEESESWKATKKWMLENCPRVMQMKDPFTEAQFERIKKEFSSAQIKDILLKMHNYKPLHTKSVSANLTFRNWAKKDFNGSESVKPNEKLIQTPQEWLQ